MIGKGLIQSLVSIILPVYNVEPYLQRCIDSLCCQTYSNIEILLVDDGSDDRCGKICDCAAQKDSRVRVFHKLNGGTGSARNMGLDNMKGDLVTFVDPDDTVEPDYVAYLLGILEQFSADIAFCPVSHIGFPNFGKENYSEVTNCFFGQEAARNILCGTHGFGGSMCHTMFKKFLFDENRFLGGSYGEDLEVVYRLAWNAKRFVIGNIPKYNYCYRKNNSSSTPIEVRYQSWREVIDTISYEVDENYSELRRAVKVRENSNSIFLLKDICMQETPYPEISVALRKTICANIPAILFYDECPFGTKVFSLSLLFGLKAFRIAYKWRLAYN